MTDLPQNPGEPRPEDSATGTNGESAAPQWAPPSGAQPAYAPTSPPPGVHPTSVLSAVPPQKKRRGGLVAAALAGTLIVGGAAGGGVAALVSGSQDGGINGGAATSQVVDAKAPKGSVEKVAAKVLPSVVKIDVSGAQESGSGSGVILSSDGVILTNNHVVEVATGSGQGQGQGQGQDPFGTDPFGQNPFGGEGGSSGGSGGGSGGSSGGQGGSSSTGSITVDFNNGKSASAHVLGTDPLTDMAVIKVDGVSGLTPATLGKSSHLVVGQSVVAIGSPFGLDSTVTTGIVSALNRPVNVGSDSSGNATVYPAIQTDAAINPGNSGGALVDLNGNVVGINASIRSTSSDSSGEAGSIGLGFAIPIDEVLPVIDQLKAGHKATHARLGISVSDSAPAQSGKPTVTGASVQNVGSGSAAQKAGMKKGDIITKVDDHLINGSDSLVATVRSYRPGDKVKVTWVSGGATKSADITLDTDTSTS